jgi:DNA sulfur modification protein DndD
MIFTELVLQNFGPYYGKNVINLRTEKEDDYSSPIILFGGMNGGGKTTIMDAIRLALYGARAQCSSRGNLSYSEFLTQCVNNNAAKELDIEKDHQTRIELSFEHFHYDHWKELKIVRYWTKNLKDGKDTLGILEGDWPDLALTNTWDEYIETLLPVGISNLFLFDGEQVKELAEQEKPPQVVFESIKALLGLELADKLAIDLDILASRKRKTFANEFELVNLEETELKLSELNKKKQKIDQKLDNLKQELEIAQREQTNAGREFMNQGGKIASEKSKLQTSINHLTNEAEKQRELLREIAANLAPLGLILPLLHQAKNQGEKELKSEQAKISLAVLEERDQRLLDFLLSINANNFADINSYLIKENEELKQQINEGEKPWLNIKNSELKQLDNLLDIVLPSELKKAEEIIESLDELDGKIEAKERELAVAAAPEEYDKLQKNLEKYEQKYNQCKQEHYLVQNQQVNLEKEIEKIKKDLEKYGEKIIDRQNKEHILNSITKVKDTLIIFKEKLTLRKLNKLEIEVSECFRYLLHKSNLVHRVVINSSDFSLSIYDPNGHQLPKHRLSAGEKQLLAIAFLWGLARVSGRNLPVAIDTPLGRLDSSHRNNLIERYFPTASHQVILLSTDTEIGKKEVAKLRDQGAIAREYLLKYDPEKRQTKIESGYFW